MFLPIPKHLKQLFKIFLVLIQQSLNIAILHTILNQQIPHPLIRSWDLHLIQQFLIRLTPHKLIFLLLLHFHFLIPLRQFFPLDLNKFPLLLQHFHLFCFNFCFPFLFIFMFLLFLLFCFSFIFFFFLT